MMDKRWESSQDGDGDPWSEFCILRAGILHLVLHRAVHEDLSLIERTEGEHVLNWGLE